MNLWLTARNAENTKTELTPFALSAFFAEIQISFRKAYCVFALM